LIGRFPSDEITGVQRGDESASNKSAGTKSGTANTVIIRRKSGISSADFPSPPVSRREFGNTQDDPNEALADGNESELLPVTATQMPSKLRDIVESARFQTLKNDWNGLKDLDRTAEERIARHQDGSGDWQSLADNDPDSSNISSNASLTSRPSSSKRPSLVSAMSHNSITAQSEMTIGPMVKFDKHKIQDAEPSTQSTIPYSTQWSPESSQDSDDDGVATFHTALAARPLSPVLIRIDKGSGKQLLELAAEISTIPESSSIDGSLLDAHSPKHERQRTDIMGA
jgi:hypothetical protein